MINSFGALMAFVLFAALFSRHEVANDHSSKIPCKQIKGGGRFPCIASHTSECFVQISYTALLHCNLKKGIFVWKSVLSLGVSARCFIWAMH